jgi:hypothetical protein
MALLELQMMELPQDELSAAPNNSGASKGCNNSVLSLLLC